MCGIVGFVGDKNGVPMLMDGLSKLEYRGYDSAGIAFIDSENKIVVKKALGKLKNLYRELSDTDKSAIGIGHTRWATHGKPSVINAHPHVSGNLGIAVIHNGIIENYKEVKDFLLEEGYTFESETDTEVIAHLIEYNFIGEKDLLKAVKKTVDDLDGAYAIGVISKDEPDKIIAVRKDSPLIIGLGKNSNYLASDIPALIKYTRDVMYINNDEIVCLKKNSVVIYNSFLQEQKREVNHITWDFKSAERGGFSHFTIKEIHEQPKGINDTVNTRITKNNEINIEFSFNKEDLEKISRVYIVGCGTAYHAGLVGKYIIEKLTRIVCDVEVASEFRYSDKIVDENTMFIAVSQSGETIDTLQALRKAKEGGAKILSILNVVGSSIARESDEVLYTWAGPEIGVASTKAYTTQLASFYMIALKLASIMETISEEELNDYISELKELPTYIHSVIDENEYMVRNIAGSQFNNDNIFFIGRGVDYYSATEASLKLKELSYINSFAIPAGELKHGTIALVEDGTFIVVFSTNKLLYKKTASNIQEVKARGAEVLVITHDDNDELSSDDSIIYLPRIREELSPILSIIPMQLFAYYVSIVRGNDVDRPRNLAKSVTVE